MREYAQLVRDLKKSPTEILADVTANDLDLIHMIMGISGEAGELLDAVKKATIYRKPIDITNIKEELGDLEFYMEGLRQILGLTREEILDANITKLRERYGKKYSNKAAQERRDKVREQSEHLADISMSDIRESTDDIIEAANRELSQVELEEPSQLPPYINK